LGMAQVTSSKLAAFESHKESMPELAEAFTANIRGYFIIYKLL